MLFAESFYTGKWFEGVDQESFLKAVQCPTVYLKARYVFTVYALDSLLDISEDSRKKNLLEAMQGHILTEASLTGKYRRN